MGIAIYIHLYRWPHSEDHILDHLHSSFPACCDDDIAQRLHGKASFAVCEVVLRMSVHFFGGLELRV